MIQLILFFIVLLGMSFVLGISAIKALTLSTPHKSLDLQVQLPVLIFALLQVIHVIVPNNSYLTSYGDFFKHLSWMVIFSEFYFYPQYILKSLSLSFRIAPLLVLLAVMSQVGYILSVYYEFTSVVFTTLGFVFGTVLIAVERVSVKAIMATSSGNLKQFYRQFTLLGLGLGIYLILLSSLALFSIAIPNAIKVTPFILFSIALLYFGTAAYVKEFKVKRKANSSKETIHAFSKHHDLTKREQEVLELLFLVKEHKEVASKLNISLHTVKTHMQNIYRKTDTSGKTDLTHMVYDFSNP